MGVEKGKQRSMHTRTEQAKRLSRMLQFMDRAALPDLAARLERGAGIGKARMWLGVQTDYDLWQAEHREQPFIQPIAIHA
ncbi:hypothetical protein [Pseudomonas sp. 31-12]|uniref:hypothetical protein n=1 Tax=Pseudomonas sp. 31-12 TaxID=2201356 RepID=UPI00267AEDDB